MKPDHACMTMKTAMQGIASGIMTLDCSAADQAQCKSENTYQPNIHKELGRTLQGNIQKALSTVAVGHAPGAAWQHKAAPDCKSEHVAVKLRTH